MLVFADVKALLTLGETFDSMAEAFIFEVIHFSPLLFSPKLRSKAKKCDIP